MIQMSLILVEMKKVEMEVKTIFQVRMKIQKASNGMN
jgi:hypothetical protein